MKKDKKLIDLYKEWMKTGMMTEDGLCICMPDEYEKPFRLLYPTREDKIELLITHLSDGFWASGLSREDDNKYATFTPLRQTIVLLICAMCDEL